MLSTFPFPKAEMGNTLRHYLPLLTLMETINVLLLVSLYNLATDPGASPGPSLKQTSLAPLCLPTNVYDGLNRVLPSQQQGQL